MSNTDAPAGKIGPIRLHKYMALCGVASRRACEALIAAGRVRVDGAVVAGPVAVDPARQRVEVDGCPIRPQPFRYLLFHKPRGVLSAMSDDRGRRTLSDLLPAGSSRLYHVGRLDRDSEGLLLLTNDGDFALRLTHPRYGVVKTYMVWCDTPLEANGARRIVRGIRDGGEWLRARSIREVASAVYEVVLAEGRKREVRRLFAACGVRVIRLLRTAIGPVQLGDLPAGRCRELTPHEVEALRFAARENFHRL
ncbi:MAG: rRNA pseudouridine synthase [Kiritimatiellae bacterium]|nr:rRNA pseudouridine synthase [Kiritimatiellia bacterium]MDW8457556.1 pseudouridine synthase [Verrucomicrobiota bacterium]